MGSHLAGTGGHSVPVSEPISGQGHSVTQTTSSNARFVEEMIGVDQGEPPAALPFDRIREQTAHPTAGTRAGGQLTLHRSS